MQIIIIFISFVVYAFSSEAIFIAKRSEVSQFVYAKEYKDIGDQYEVTECYTAKKKNISKKEYFLNELAEACTQVSRETQIVLINQLLKSNQFESLKIQYNDKILSLEDFQKTSSSGGALIRPSSTGKFQVIARPKKGANEKEVRILQDKYQNVFQLDKSLLGP